MPDIDALESETTGHLHYGEDGFFVFAYTLSNTLRKKQLSLFNSNYNFPPVTGRETFVVSWVASHDEAVAQLDYFIHSTHFDEGIIRPAVHCDVMEFVDKVKRADHSFVDLSKIRGCDLTNLRKAH